MPVNKLEFINERKKAEKLSFSPDISDEKHRNEIIYHFTRSFPDKKKSNLGKYYTPKHLVELVFEMVKSHVYDKSLILDISSGCGAFLDCFDRNRTIGREIDTEAVEMMKSLGFKNVQFDNSLYNVNRKKYNLGENDHLVIVGNPPYNDATSKNKKYGSNAKVKLNVKMDDDLKSNDLGISFIKAYCKLKADAICILHPLSYLIKETNFKRLSVLTNNYILKDGLIFSSKEFKDTQKTPFPVLVALYIPGKMDYEYIKNFPFDILNDSRKFILRNIETIDGYIRKYPPKRTELQKSDIGLYMYNIRDINSLLTSGNFTEKENFNYHITINFKDLYKYAYLNCMKRYFEKDFLFGNLSPIVDREALEKDESLRDMFLIDTIINNQHLSVFNKNNEESVIHKKNLFENFKRKKQRLKKNKLPIYDIFINFIEDKIYNKKLLEEAIKRYFEKLKAKYFHDG